ncbi:MAG: alpha/beta fold hydrolase [Betaproteobacteria bacterium]
MAGRFAPPPYRAPAWLPGGHAQTIWPWFVTQSPLRWRREIVAAPDGDRWAFDWLDAPARDDAPLCVLFHGLEGGATSPYAVALMDVLAARGWRGVVPHFRGCGGVDNQRPRAYHLGDHEEIAAMLAAIRGRVGDRVTIHAAGVSLGGSALLNWLGRAGTAATALVARAAAVSAPHDAMAAGRAIDRGLNRFYAYVFLRTMNPKARAIAWRHPDAIDPAGVRAYRTMWAFDDAVTAPLHGFAGAEDYWTRASAKPWLLRIGVPTLVLNARNDPFIPAASLARPGDAASCVVLEQPEQGGHAGFVTGPFPGRLAWLPERLLAWFEQAAPVGPV